MDQTTVIQRDVGSSVCCRCEDGVQYEKLNRGLGHSKESGPLTKEIEAGLVILQR